MIRSNNCIAMFEADEDLTAIVAIVECDDYGKWSETHRYQLHGGNLLDETESLRIQIINGCPDCLDDAYEVAA